MGFRSYSFGGYNTINGNSDDGIRITSSSNPNFGNSNGGSLGGFNSILNNTNYEIENTSGNYIQAYWNWWGSEYGLGSSTLYGNVYWYPNLDYDPNSQQKSSFGLPVYSFDEDSELPEDLQIAMFEQNVGEYEKSAEKYKKHFTEEKDTKFHKLAAVNYVKSLSNKLDNSSVKAEIETTLKKKQTAEVECELLSAEAVYQSYLGEFSSAIEKLDKALELKLDKETEYRLICQKAMIYIYDFNETDKSKSIFEDILKNSNKESPWYELAEAELQILNGRKSILPKHAVKSDYTVIPDEFRLIGNYPNPFNPNTKIKYALPSISHVNITIYNIMGREIKSFNSNLQSAGTHELEWKGTNNYGDKVSSGIYLLRFEAVSQENNKHFVKTSKLMLVK